MLAGYLNVRTPERLIITILYLNELKSPGCVANRVDSDPRRLICVYTVCFGLSIRIISVNTVIIIAFYFITSILVFITKTCLYNFDPLKPHFYIIKPGFIGVYIIYFFFC